MTRIPIWQDRAACASADPSWFDDPSDRPRSDGAHDYVMRVQRALAFCRRCPVTQQCLLEGIAYKESSIRGGVVLDRGQVVAMLALPTDRPSCSSHRGWRAHREHKEQACYGCAIAERDWQRDRYRERKAAAG